MEESEQSLFCYKGLLLDYLSKTSEVAMEWICSSDSEEI